MSMSSDLTGVAGKHVLVVEDEYFLAEEIAAAVRQAGGIVVGPAPDVESALALIEEHRVDAAILDVRLGDDTSFPIAKRLREKNLPAVFVTGFDDWFLPDDLDDVPIYRKPADPENVIRVLFEAKPDKRG